MKGDIKYRSLSVEDVVNFNKSSQNGQASSSVYINVGGWIYEVPASYYAQKHPGGEKAILSVLAPEDCSTFFETTRGGVGHSDTARGILGRFIVGHLGNDPPASLPGQRVHVKRGIGQFFKEFLLIMMFLLFHIGIFLVITGRFSLNNKEL